MKFLILILLSCILFSACKKDEPCTLVCETTQASAAYFGLNDNCECVCYYERPLVFIDDRPFCIPTGMNSDNGFIANPSETVFACYPEELLILQINPDMEDARTGDIFVSHYGSPLDLIWVTYIKDDITSDTYNFTRAATGTSDERCEVTQHYNGKVVKLENGNMLLNATYFLTSDDLNNQINPYKSIEIEFNKLEY